jgi:hypothetical protein
LPARPPPRAGAAAGGAADAATGAAGTGAAPVCASLRSHRCSGGVWHCLRQLHASPREPTPRAHRLQLLQNAGVQTLAQKLLLRRSDVQVREIIRCAVTHGVRHRARTRDLAITSVTTLPYSACTSALLALMLQPPKSPHESSRCICGRRGACVGHRAHKATRAHPSRAPETRLKVAIATVARQRAAAVSALFNIESPRFGHDERRAARQGTTAAFGLFVCAADQHPHRRRATSCQSTGCAEAGACSPSPLVCLDRLTCSARAQQAERARNWPSRANVERKAS